MLKVVYANAGYNRTINVTPGHEVYTQIMNAMKNQYPELNSGANYNIDTSDGLTTMTITKNSGNKA